MGDILHALPAVTALRRMHPGWVIDWVVEGRWSALLAADRNGERGSTRPIVDGLHIAATREWRKAPFSAKTIHEINDLRKNLRAGRYDVVIDLQGSIRSAVIGRLTGCRRRIGELEPREWAASLLFTEHVATTGAHVIEQDLEVATAVAGDELTAGLPWLPVDPTAARWAEKILPASSQPAVLINPGAGWGAKRWPVERYAQVAQALTERGCRVVVNAGPGEEALAASICDGTGGAAIALSCSVAELIEITRRVGLVIAGDTGPLHLGCALGKSVVGIFGPTDPSRNGPFGSPFKVLRSPESRRDHKRHAEPEAGLLTIQADDVLRAAEEFLKSGEYA